VDLRLDPREIGRTLDELAEIGNRHAGGEGEAQARDRLLERFRELGLQRVRLEAFPYLRAHRAAAQCAVGTLRLSANALQYTAPVQAAGRALYVGEATEEDWARLDALGARLQGRIAVVHSVFPFDLSGALIERGIAGLVHVCETPDGIVGNFAGALYPPPLAPPWEGRPLPYPGVTIAHPAGRALISTLTARPDVEVTLGHDARYEEAVAYNVIGELDGEGEDQAEHVIVCAHYDSQAEGPCVYDNATGVASLLECARVLSRRARARRIVLIASAAEEIGCWGASAYVHAHRDELPGAVGMVNLDGVASAYPSRREIWSADAGMAALAERIARGCGWIADRVMNVRSTFGDHAPFGDAGVPSCLIWRPEHPYYHSRGDVRDRVDEFAVAQTAGVSAALIDHLAGGGRAGGPPRLGA